MEGEYRGQLSQLNYQRQFVHKLFDRMFEIIFENLKREYASISKIPYGDIDRKILVEYQQKLESLKKDIIIHQQNESLQITQLIHAQKIEIDLLLQRNEKRFSKFVNMHHDLEELMNSTEGIICTTKNKLSEIYQKRIRDFDNEQNEKIKLLNEEFTDRCTKISEEYKQRLMSALEIPERKSEVPLSSLKTQIAILRENVETSKKQYNDIMKAYKSFSKFPSLVLKELFDSLNIHISDSIKSQVQEHYDNNVKIQKLYLEYYESKFNHKLKDHDLFITMLNKRDLLLDYLCNLRVLPQDEARVENDTSQQEKEVEILDKEYTTFQEILNKRISEYELRFKEEIQQKQFELQQEHELAIENISLPTTSDLNDYKSEYDALTKIYQNLETAEISTKPTTEDEILYYKLKLELEATRISRIKIQEATDTINSKLQSKDTIQITLLQNKIQQEESKAQFLLENQENFYKSKLKHQEESIKNMNEYIDKMRTIHNNALEDLDQVFNDQLDSVIETHNQEKQIIMREDPEVSKAIDHLNFARSKASLSDSAYIAFLERYIYQTAIK
ncbi:hypothetical protein TVAG_228240 [Trichomonas vaginalis G3]|uniref:Uncharacterized protein n=1 Tax=Trichomonas vaginalis (strain ATCC PRA-98 / G3) TaxID=412133 RepID=A2DIY6_TRIV3|nr:hypothetical protein TVAGG3_0483720 [Trichomonas vaginalis G3]EAY19561.1 hypothetical protein TVAG_228240 [Trichomonas vaginalis G3]KAI5515890.1 hypothetical protein TVAGG3_0483720 [Trichomonas vaginalis G3]|eukprot:XP_001580547.1 hypothetical protein [Trichomonas vaginalis G3]